MNSLDRRERIYEKLLKAKGPIKGVDISKELQVTRQVIVKDIAILRAEGKNIIATPEGYIINKSEDHRIRRVIAVNHGKDQVRDELSIIVKYGGIIENVIVEHPLYGEIKAGMHVKTIADVDSFMKSFEKNDSKPLSSLTEGTHLHTIAAESDEILDKIVEELKNKNYIIAD